MRSLFSKKPIILLTCISILFAFSIGVNANTLDDGNYVASAEGYGGELKVEVKVESGELIEISIIDHEETERIAETPFERIPAQIIERQSTEDIEMVTGATMTSEALVEAVDKALEKASPSLELKDGDYQGAAEGYGGELKVEVKVESGELIEISIIDHEETERIAETPFKRIPAQIIENQSTEDIEMVTGATMTSEALIDAVDDALDKAIK